MNAWAGTPQATEIDALIERAGGLTNTDAFVIGAAWNELRGKWQNEYIEATRDAAWKHGRMRGRWGVIAAAAAANPIAVGGIGAAGSALLLRDLIDQEVYDFLTAPWAAVVGPAHPDDVQVEVRS